MNIKSTTLSVVVSSIVGVFLFANQAQAVETTVKAMATWQAQGLVTQVGKDQALMVGALAGALFIDGGHGDLDATSLLCPGTMDLKPGDGVRNGKADASLLINRAIKSTQNGPAVVMKKAARDLLILRVARASSWAISGDNKFILRVAMRANAGAVSDDSFQQVAAGLAIWPKLRYELKGNFR